VLGTATLRWTVARVQPESLGRTLSLVVAGSVLRLVLAALLLLAALKQGIMPALLLLLGMLLTRSILMLVWRRPWTDSSTSPSTGLGRRSGRGSAERSGGQEEDGALRYAQATALPPAQDAAADGAAAGSGL